MEALDSGGSGIDHQHIPPGITHHLEYMRMTAYKYVRTELFDEPSCTWIVFSGIAPDVCHKYLKPSAFEETVQRMDEAQVVIVAVAGHTHQRLEPGNIFSQIHTSTEISCVPDLVDRLQKVPERLIENPVSIRNKAYKHNISAFVTVQN